MYFIMKPTHQYNCDNVVVDFGNKINKKLTYFVYHHDELPESNGLLLTGDSQISDFEKIKATSDYYDGVVSIPIISGKAKQVLEKELDAPFITLSIDNHDDFYTFPISEMRGFVDLDKSTYRELTDGSKIIDAFAYKQVDDDFFIAKDKSYPYKFFVSQRFIDLCRENSLKIDFDVVVIGKPRSFFS
ncbi:hypothetical protein [Plesiomonas sp. ZOR0011]|uniref:hypothetical protein n=1 Tax=Plesiomonas sp. ZOR0011 TaxID=1339230 RepID=UPI000646C268|nr:hypothetical protein [Plesiomonas sp. ZOR0011]